MIILKVTLILDRYKKDARKTVIITHLYDRHVGLTYLLMNLKKIKMKNGRVTCLLH